ncbi:fimbrial outer membrane usher protein [Escherichia coli]|nr:fimbrial outer membrane usher protein [Escherichia coli]
MQMVNRYLLEPLLRYKMQVWQIQELSVTVANFIFLVYQKKDRLRYPGGENASTKCIFNYSLSTPESESGLIEQGVTCH